LFYYLPFSSIYGTVTKLLSLFSISYFYVNNTLSIAFEISFFAILSIYIVYFTNYLASFSYIAYISSFTYVNNTLSIAFEISFFAILSIYIVYFNNYLASFSYIAYISSFTSVC